MRLALVCLAAGLIAGCTALPRTERSAARVVVPLDQFGSIHSGTKPWSPTEADLLACERSLSAALAKTSRDLGKYYLRVSGMVHNGHRYIVGMAAHTGALDSKHYLQPPDENRIILQTFGGGSGYFRFEYDCDSATVATLSFNAAL